MAQQPAKTKEHPDVKAMQEHREERKRLTEEAMKRMESSQPTPTQEENDLAKVGVIVEKKEDDKSGRTVITHTIVANEPLAAHGYETSETREARNEAQARGRTMQGEVRSRAKE